MAKGQGLTEPLDDVKRVKFMEFWLAWLLIWVWIGAWVLVGELLGDNLEEERLRRRIELVRVMREV